MGWLLVPSLFSHNPVCFVCFVFRLKYSCTIRPYRMKTSVCSWSFPVCFSFCCSSLRSSFWMCIQPIHWSKGFQWGLRGGCLGVGRDGPLGTPRQPPGKPQPTPKQPPLSSDRIANKEPMVLGGSKRPFGGSGKTGNKGFFTEKTTLSVKYLTK